MELERGSLLVEYSTKTAVFLACQSHETFLFFSFIQFTECPKDFCQPFRGGGTPYNGLYGEAPPERGTFFRLEVYERVGISRAEV